MAKKKKLRIINYVKDGVVMRSEVAPEPEKRLTTKWSEEEIRYLKDNFQKVTTRQLSEDLGRSWESVRGQLKRFKLTVGEELRKERQASRKGVPSGRVGVTKWTEEAVNYLKENHFTKPLPEICEHLNLKYGIVYKKMRALGLEVNPEITLQARREGIGKINAEKKAYFASEDFLAKKRNNQLKKRTNSIKERLMKRELSEIQKIQNEIKKSLKKIEKNDEMINKLVLEKQNIRAEIKRSELRIKVITDKLNANFNKKSGDV
jgi:hypothetical protein